MNDRALSRYLVAYSAVVTLAFALTVYFGLVRPVHAASGVADFDRIRAHRIDLVEPDGTERLILSNRTDYPGSFFHGKEVKRADRNDAAGMLFLNDEGTEDGGLIFGGRMKDGKPMSFGHLSFDEYDQDQAVVLDTGLENGKKYARMQLNDLSSQPLTTTVVEEGTRVQAMPEGKAKEAAMKAFAAKVPPIVHRMTMTRSASGDNGLALYDAAGHVRLRLNVAADGTPQVQALRADGTVVRDLLAK